MSNINSSNSTGTAVSINNVTAKTSAYGLSVNNVTTSGNYVAGLSLANISSDNINNEASVNGFIISNVTGSNTNSETTGIKLQTISSTRGPIKGIDINDISTSENNCIGISINNITSTNRNDCIGITIDNLNSDLGCVGLKIGSNLISRDPNAPSKAIEQLGINNSNIYNEFQSRVVIGTGEAGNSININDPYGALSIYGSARYTAKHVSDTVEIYDISRNSGNLYSFNTSGDNRLAIILPEQPENGTFYKFINIRGNIIKIDGVGTSGRGKNINGLIAFDWAPSRPYMSCDVWYSSDLGEWVTDAEMLEP
jgi:hypothetical protein